MQSLHKTVYTAVEAMRLGDVNEKYSRKHNLNTKRFTEKDKDKRWKLVQDFLKSTLDIGLDNR